MKNATYPNILNLVFNSGIMIFFLGLIVGCAMTPQPTIDVFIEPIESSTNTSMNPETGAVTIVQKGVAVTIRPLDEVELFSLTENPRINPFIIVENNGNVTPIYTVFELVVHNLESSRVLVDESALLIDHGGAQYANLPYDYFKDLYQNVDENGQTAIPPSHHPYVRRNYPFYQTYLDLEALKDGHAIVAESLFESGKLFHGAKRRGYIVFDKLGLDTTDMRIIIPQIRIVVSDNKQEKLKFKFDFRQVVAEK